MITNAKPQNVSVLALSVSVVVETRSAGTWTTSQITNGEEAFKTAFKVHRLTGFGCLWRLQNSVPKTNKDPQLVASPKKADKKIQEANMTLKSLSPIISINDPQVIWSQTPANLILEIQFLCLFFLCTYDAFWRQKNRLYRIAWWMSLSCGILIELATILPREIGNFYHSQFTVMLFDYREPLYMLPCVYVWFLYTFTTVIWHCKWSSKMSEYAFTVVLIYFVWQPFDWIGIHFQFWTWHNDEPLYHQRRGGVPVASTFWMMSFIGGMQLTLRIIRDHYFLGQRTNWHRSPNGITCIWLALCGSLLNLSIFMMIPFALIYHPISNRNFGLGLSCSFAMHCFLGLCGFVVIMHLLRNRNKLSIRPNEGGFLYTFCLQIVFGYVMVCCVMMHWIDIRGLKQESYHQMLAVHGQQQRESSFWGWFQRNSFVVENGIDPHRDHYHLECYDFDKMFDGQHAVSWYALCATGLEPQWIAYFDLNLGVAVVLLFVIQLISFSHGSLMEHYSRLSKMKQM